MARVQLLGVPLDPVTADEAVAALLDYVRSSAQHHVMTPNAEMLVAASRDARFRDLLNQTALNLPDSAGLLWMANWTHQYLPERVTGVDTVTSLCARLTPDQSVFFLGAAPGVAEKASIILRMKFPNLRIAGTYGGSPSTAEAPEIVERIQQASPSVLLVAYGAPAQDLWIDHHLKNLSSVRLAMGVGGTFDFIAGTQVRAPKLLQRLHLEWAWRVLLQPSRWKRILNAVIVFPLLVVRHGKEAPRT
jgi:N-acetylglucosaminyldiphosphoundecaprenol N-acetyl-beta-D-mannosaminyltransferase